MQMRVKLPNGRAWQENYKSSQPTANKQRTGLHGLYARCTRCMHVVCTLSCVIVFSKNVHFEVCEIQVWCLATAYFTREPFVSLSQSDGPVFASTWWCRYYSMNIYFNTFFFALAWEVLDWKNAPSCMYHFTDWPTNNRGSKRRSAKSAETKSRRTFGGRIEETIISWESQLVVCIYYP